MPKIKEKLKEHYCNDCKVDGVIICTATKSNGKRCNKGALSLKEARERKRQINKQWHNYLDSLKKKRTQRVGPPPSRPT